ncbi:MAG: hypothetical protein O7D91_03430 [Planctomycetota bacterium]|nr:hypothetical protein [Planctomycetota bacterium]
MSTSDHIERVSAVLEGRQPDRPPVSFWHHFDTHQRCGPAAVQAHLDHVRTYDLDFLKVMNDNGYPKPCELTSVRDLEALQPQSGEEPEFARQLELLEALSGELSGHVLMATTLFNAWATLRKLIKPKPKPGPPDLTIVQAEADRILAEFLAEDCEAVARAVRVIAESLTRFAARCVQAGADGIFLSVRDDWLDSDPDTPGSYDELVRPTDLQILGGVSDARFNMLHVCGRPLNFAAFAEYPVHVINWADRAAGPSIAEAIKTTPPAICGGVDNLAELPNGTAQQVAAQVRDALAQADERPILIGPGCTFDPQVVPSENLHAMCEAARSA